MSEFPDSPTIAEEWARACRTVVVQGAGARPVKVVGRDGSVIREATTVEVFTKLAEAAQIATVLRDGVVPPEIVEAANARRAAGLADQCSVCGCDLGMSSASRSIRSKDPREWLCRSDASRLREASMTPEQREKRSKAMKARNAAMTQPQRQQRVERSRIAGKKTSLEQLRDMSRRGNAVWKAMTPEQRSRRRP